MEEKEERNGEGASGSGISPKVFGCSSSTSEGVRSVPCFGSFLVISRSCPCNREWEKKSSRTRLKEEVLSVFGA